MNSITWPILFPEIRDDPASRQQGYRSIAIGICLSLLLHGLLLFLSAPNPTTGEFVASQQTKGPLIVRLIQAEPVPPTPAVAPEPERAREPEREPAPVRRRNPIIAVPKPPQRPPIAVERPLEPVPIQQPAAPPAMDFLAMINAKRQATEEATARANAEARANSREPTAEEMALANINRNLRADSRDGTSGVFQILSKGTRTAQFSFRGWTTDSRNDWRQVIDVDAGLHGDIELAIVRKMIELIRTHYQGNFNWESHRLGRVIVLSARLEDNTALEAFLLREFFGGS